MVTPNVTDIKTARHNGVDCFIRIYLIGHYRRRRILAAAAVKNQIAVRVLIRDEWREEVIARLLA
jgi:hypothetical protein